MSDPDDFEISMPMSDAMGRASNTSGEKPALAGAGLRFGRYTTIRLLGKGGMAEVYLAKQDGPAGFQKTCVIKRMRRVLAEEPRFVDMFLREARVAARLNHNNVVQIFELVQDEGDYLIAMEYLDGISLHRAARRCWANETSIPMEVVLRAISDAAMGLHHAHTQRDATGDWAPLVHRDVSPDNLVVTRDGITKVLDFGIAKADSEVDEVTKTGELKGKIPYMSPEQIRGEALDGRSDLWALGVTLYWLLTGKRPFDGGSDHMTIDHILRSAPVPPRALNALIPLGLQNIILSLLQKDRRHRLASGIELRDRLVELLGPAAGPGSASSFCNKVMDMPANEGNVGPSSVLTIVAARPETQWLKRVSEGSDHGDLLSLVPSNEGRTAPIAGQAQQLDVETNETASNVHTGSLVYDQRRVSRVLPIAAGLGLTVLLGLGATFLLQFGDPPDAVPHTPSVLAETPPPDSATAPPPSSVAPPDPAPPAPAPPSAATTPPVAPPGARSTPPEAKPKSERRSSGMAVQLRGPKTVTWKTTKGKRLRRGPGKGTVPNGTSSVLAIDRHTGGVTTVPVTDGVADFSKVAQGQLVLRIRPWAKARVGNKTLGTTPIDPVSLPAGRYQVTLVWNDTTKTKTIEVKPRRQAVLKVDMRK